MIYIYIYIKLKPYVLLVLFILTCQKYFTVLPKKWPNGEEKYTEGISQKNNDYNRVVFHDNIYNYNKTEGLSDHKYPSLQAGMTATVSKC